MSMILPCYPAMTAAEFSAAEQLPANTGWMACHFSSSGKGLSNIPAHLPPGSLLILSDEIPICGHDPRQILQELSDTIAKQSCCGLLLDLQRQDVDETASLCRILVDQLPCPVGITEYYAQDLPCPVFLSPPLRKPLEQILAPWRGREIWLEAALDAQEVTITNDGATIRSCPLSQLPEPYFLEKALHCRYHWQKLADRVVFTVQRTSEDLISLLESASRLGVTKAVGLYQQLRFFPEFL